MTSAPGGQRVSPKVDFQESGLGEEAGAPHRPSPWTLGGRTLPAAYGLGILQPEVDTTNTSDLRQEWAWALGRTSPLSTCPAHVVALATFLRRGAHYLAGQSQVGGSSCEPRLGRDVPEAPWGQLFPCPSFLVTLRSDQSELRCWLCPR